MIIFAVNLMTHRARYVEFSMMQDIESKKVREKEQVNRITASYIGGS